MTRSNLLYITDILESIQDIETFKKDLTKEVFLKDTKEQYAIIRCLEIIGEASVQLPADFKKEYLEIPWHILKGLRNILIHDYVEIDLDVIWNIITNDIPPLKIEIQRVLQVLKVKQG